MSENRPGKEGVDGPGGHHDSWQDHLHSETYSGSRAGIDSTALVVPALTVVWHPSVDRIGERILLPELLEGRAVQVSRLEPLWQPRAETEARPLADPRFTASKSKSTGRLVATWEVGCGPYRPESGEPHFKPTPSSGLPRLTAPSPPPGSSVSLSLRQ